MIAKLQPCLWFDGNAEEASRFYADKFPETRIGAVNRAPDDYDIAPVTGDGLRWRATGARTGQSPRATASSAAIAKRFFMKSPGPYGVVPAAIRGGGRYQK